MFFFRLRNANLRLLTSSLALLAKGVTQNATKKGGIPEDCMCMKVGPEATDMQHEKVVKSTGKHMSCHDTQIASHAGHV